MKTASQAFVAARNARECFHSKCNGQLVLETEGAVSTMVCNRCKSGFTECPKCKELALFESDGYVGEGMASCEKCDYCWSGDPRPYIE